MINTSDFKTRTILTERQNLSVPGILGIALDIGYSSVKGFSNNMVYCFPSYARKITTTMLGFGEASPNDIQYKDNATGELWVIGESAQNMISSDETKDSNESLYGRNRYYSDMFSVIARAGLGIGMMKNSINPSENKKLVVQTGLPPAYLKSDTYMLQDVLSGHHDFSIKIGNRPWIKFSFDLPIENVSVIAQPMGTLLSISTDTKGKPIADASKYFKSNMLIFDPGFGTLDVFNLKNRMITSTETFDDLGMKRILTETANEIFKKYHQEIKVPAMQKSLETGEIKCFDRKARATTLHPFADILDKANKKICYEALAKIDTIYNNLFDHEYLVITGGTGAAWSRLIRDYYKNMKNLTIISGNQNDNLPYIFSNVRGYHMYLISRLNR